jgi:hypothetical protein
MRLSQFGVGAITSPQREKPFSARRGVDQQRFAGPARRQCRQPENESHAFHAATTATGEMPMKIVALLLALLCAGCASYVTPGGSVRLSDIDRADIAAAAARKPSPNFPARLAIVRVQAPRYYSYSGQAYGGGQYSVLTTQELLGDTDVKSVESWPSLAAVVTVNRLLLPDRFDSLDDLRLASAKLQADVLLVYTMDTTFRVLGRRYAPLSPISLGILPDRDAFVTSTASAVFVDVRTGFVYGLAEGSAQVSNLTNIWSSRTTIDRKRLEAEQQSFAKLVTAAATTWDGIVRQYQ